MRHEWSGTSARQVETRATYNLVGLRETEKTKGTDLMSLLQGPADGLEADTVYTARYEVDTSGKFQLSSDWEPGALLTGSGRDYDYDPIGNRTRCRKGSNPNVCGRGAAVRGRVTMTTNARLAR